MLKFLTHKLRTHSLNEESVSEKVEEHDSGTESDDEADRPRPGEADDADPDITMKWNEGTDINMSEESCACAPRLMAAPDADQLYDHHSSEEELEVINGAPVEVSVSAAESRRRGASSPPPTAPEKRKWPAEAYCDVDEVIPRPPSSDDDDIKVETPVRFRTSPPLEALKPRGSRGVGGAGCVGGAPAPSPRRRRAAPTVRPPRAPRRHRPALDFDKMQQLKVGGGGVTSWRQVGGAGGELSVFCW